MKKKILIVYPHNFFKEKSGINVRYIELLKYFKTRDFQVDMLTLKNFKSPWKTYPPDKWGLIDELFFYDFKKGCRWQKFKNRKKSPWTWIRKKIPFFYAYTELPDFAYKSMKIQFDEIVKANQYDFIIISYVYWANLIKSIPIKKCVTILDLSDFATLNKFDYCGGNVKIGPMIEEEIRRVNLFDKVICISEDERLFFSQFARKPHYSYIPFFIKKNDPLPTDVPLYDILFIASNNPHNQKGIQWFFDDVFPLLDDTVKVLIVGTISACVKNHKNVTCFSCVENPAEVYCKAKISICPLLGGTGIKIKVIESLSYGRPVVCTSKGVVGFPVKINNGCLIANTPEAFANSISRLLKEQDFYEKTSKKAKRFFKSHFEQSCVYKRLGEIFV
jgi:glycosyltransferase involved in cell wall biosynthesis